ncbi:MAG: hypothetical protein RLZZ618_917 [Pseudomonadota bacterium]
MLASAQAATPQLRVQGAENGLHLTAWSRVLEDPSGSLSLAQVRAQGEGWQPGPPDALVFGYTRSSWWVHTRFENASGQAQSMVIDLGSPRQDYVSWFVLRDGGVRVEEIQTGDRLPFAQRPFLTRDFVLPLALAPGEQVEVYTRLASHDGLYEPMPVRIYTQTNLVTALDQENMLASLFHGGMIALALYNLLLFIMTRERAFGSYVAYISCFVAWNLIFRGYAFQYLWPESPAFSNNVLTVAAAGIFGSVGIFAIDYLRLREEAPRWVLRGIWCLVALNVPVVVVALSGHYGLATLLCWMAGIPLTVLTLGTAVWRLVCGSRPARFYVIAFVVLAIGACAHIMQILKVLPTNAFSTWGLPIGSVFEVLLLALGLADSLNTLKAEKLAAERRERETQLALNTELEQQVCARTQALELANRRLGELAITDALTGAYNRRHFNDFCASFVAGQHRSEALAFCMLDLDHFKAYNDRYGHQAGDEVLRAVAQAVQRELKRSDDVLFRLGGEEFGVLFAATTAAAAVEFVERLRQAVHSLQFPHAGNEPGVVTASFGVAWWGDEAIRGLTPERMYVQADRLLYAAKEAGRDRVEVAALV